VGGPQTEPDPGLFPTGLGGLVKAIEEEFGETLIVPSEPQIVSALGAALLAMEDLGAMTP